MWHNFISFVSHENKWFAYLIFYCATKLFF
jgi:hypothetical protein